MNEFPRVGYITFIVPLDTQIQINTKVQTQRYRHCAAILVGKTNSLGAAKANKGVFVTTSYFTQPAKSFAERHPFRIVLIDGAQLTALMIRHNVGVRIAETLYLKKADEDFFVDE